jgi:ribonuclease J
VLNKTINESGFQQRVENGRLAANALQNELQGKGTCKVHFVCHSMGYAYMLGMIDELKGSVDFGKALILSPEAANTQGRDWSVFEEVWQYGARAVEKALKGGTRDIDALEKEVRRAAGKFVSERTKRRPMIVPIVMEI